MGMERFERAPQLLKNKIIITFIMYSMVMVHMDSKLFNTCSKHNSHFTGTVCADCERERAIQDEADWE